MRLIFLNRFFHPDHSATSQILSDLAFDLVRRGHDVSVVTSRLRYSDPDDLLPPQETVHGVHVHRVWTSSFGRSGMAGRAVDYATFYLSASLALWRIARAGDIVVAKTDPPLIALPAHAVAKLRGARFVDWLQDLYPETAERLGVRILSGPLGRLVKRMRDASLRSADATVAIGEVMAGFVRERAGDDARVEVIQNWLDETATRPVAPTDNALRQAWNPDGRFVVAYSGNLGRAHEYDTLLQAAERLRDEARLLFLFIGGGHRTRSLMAEVEKRGLGHLFRFEPYQPAERLSESLSVGTCTGSRSSRRWKG